MKKILLSFLSIFLLAPVFVKAQFTTQHDTVYATVNGIATVYNNITLTGAAPAKIRWQVVATNWPADWLTSTAFGICDNKLCRQNNSDTLLWRVATSTPGDVQWSDDYTPGVAGTFDLSLNFSGVTTVGTRYVTINLSTGPTDARTVTFIITKSPVAVSNVNATDNDVKLYPNPASDEVNLVFNQSSDIKTVAIYNVIGKMMSVYKVNGTSANLNISGIPSGIYFVRMANSRGDVVVTRKFTKQ